MRRIIGNPTARSQVDKKLGTRSRPVDPAEGEHGVALFLQVGTEVLQGAAAEEVLPRRDGLLEEPDEGGEEETEGLVGEELGGVLGDVEELLPRPLEGAPGVGGGVLDDPRHQPVMPLLHPTCRVEEGVAGRGRVGRYGVGDGRQGGSGLDDDGEGLEAPRGGALGVGGMGGGGGGRPIPGGPRLLLQLLRLRCCGCCGCCGCCPPKRPREFFRL